MTGGQIAGGRRRLRCRRAPLPRRRPRRRRGARRATGICCTSSCRRSTTRAPTSTAGAREPDALPAGGSARDPRRGRRRLRRRRPARREPRCPGSIQEEELAQVIEALQDEGLIDYLMTSLGRLLPRVHDRGGHGAARRATSCPSSGQLTAAATVPTIVTGRFRTLEEAEQVLADGVADMVSMVRAPIADPDIVRKTREGRAHEVRPCIACNQGCIGGLAAAPRGRLHRQPGGRVRGDALGGADRAGRAAPARARRRRRAGRARGGARRCALRPRGHARRGVATLGGALDAARRAPRFGLLGDIVDWLAAARRARRVWTWCSDTSPVGGGRRSRGRRRRRRRDRLEAADGRLPAGASRSSPPAASSSRTCSRRARLLTDGVPEAARTRARARHRRPLRGDRRRRVARRPGSWRSPSSRACPASAGPIVHAAQRDVPGARVPVRRRLHAAHPPPPGRDRASTCVVRRLQASAPGRCRRTSSSS